MDRVSLASYFAEINTLADLQFMPGERPYIDRPTAVAERKDLLLHLGCNVLRTAHLAKTAVDVLRAMGFDFNAAGGPAHCCGIAHHRNNDPHRAHAVAASTLRHLGRYGATRVLMWCPSCREYYDDVVTRAHHVAFAYEPVTVFIARHLDRIRFTRRIDRRVAIHCHAGHARSVQDGEGVRRILQAIPGVEVVDLDVDASFGRHCTAQWIGEVGRLQWQQAISRFLDAAKAARVDAVATVYHSCQREICQEEANHPFAIVNYITLLGEAMGIEHADVYKACKLKADVDAVFDDLRPYVEANRLDPVRVRKVLHDAFAPACEQDSVSPTAGAALPTPRPVRVYSFTDPVSPDT